MKVYVPRSAAVRLIAALLLLIAGAQLYACESADACVSGQGANGDCDQPSGDNCLCCCQHIIPVTAFALDAAEAVSTPPAPVATPQPCLLAAHIDHPPQL